MFVLKVQLLSLKFVDFDWKMKKFSSLSEVNII